MAVPSQERVVRAEGWRTLAALHAAIDGALETALQSEHALSVVEYTVLDALSQQDGWHLRMRELSRATALSASATTRLVNRLEARGLLQRVLCQDDRRGIYSELTHDGSELLRRARPTHDRVLEATLTTAGQTPELTPLVAALQRRPTGAAHLRSRG